MIHIFYTYLYPKTTCKVVRFEEKAAGKKLLRYGLQNLSFNKESIIRYNEYGKPYFESLPIYFNITHSQGLVACVLSENEIGIDVEKYKNISKKSVEFFWNPNDYYNFDYNNHYDIINVWSQKEAISKYIGYGLHFTFKDIKIEKINNSNYYSKFKKKKIYIKKLEIDNNYSAWIASEVDNDKITEVKINL